MLKNYPTNFACIRLLFHSKLGLKFLQKKVLYASTSVYCIVMKPQLASKEKHFFEIRRAGARAISKMIAKIFRGNSLNDFAFCICQRRLFPDLFRPTSWNILSLSSFPVRTKC